eukprot:705410-Pleurochrysis_carterae.AAC.1
MGTQLSSNFYRLIGHRAAAMMAEGLESQAAAQRAERQAAKRARREAPQLPSQRKVDQLAFRAPIACRRSRCDSHPH